MTWTGPVDVITQVVSSANALFGNNTWLWIVIAGILLSMAFGLLLKGKRAAGR